MKSEKDSVPTAAEVADQVEKKLRVEVTDAFLLEVASTFVRLTEV